MNSASIEALETNERLLRIYGKHVNVDKANFRVVWSEDQFEKRLGTFNVFLGEMFLREETGIREVSKYPWLDHQWLVERLHENRHQDVMEGSYIYECLYAFPKNLPLKWEAIEKVCQIALFAYKSDVPKTEKEAIYQDEEDKKREVKETRHLLDEASNPSSIELNLKDGDAVAFGGVREFNSN